MMEILFVINGERFASVNNFDGYAIGDNCTIMYKRYVRGNDRIL